MNRNFLRTIAVLLAIILSVSFVFNGCSDEPDDTESTTGVSQSAPDAHTLKLPYSKNDKLNPFTAESMLNQSICELVYDGLFSLDENYNVSPLIASKYTLSGRTLTVTLGTAKFSDGSAVTASDVVASFNSAKTSPAYKTSLAGFSKAQVSGNAVVFTLTADDPYAVNCLTFGITKGGSSQDNAAGSGRYTFVSDDSETLLKANGTRAGFSAPKISEIHLYNLQDVTSLKYTLAIGNISFAFDDLRTGEYTRFSASTKDILMNNMVFMVFNKGNSALSSEKVRQAIALLIDRDQIADKAFQGHAKAAFTPFNPDWSAIAGKDYTLKTDADAAGKLLDEAGYKTSGGSVRSNGSKQLTFKLLVNKENSFKTQAAQNIKEMLEKAKISVTVEALGEAEYKKAVSSGKYDMYIGEIKLTDNMNISPMLTKGGAVSYGINTSGTASTAYSAMLAGTVDVFSFIETFNSDLPFLPLCYRCGIAAYTRSISYKSSAHINDIYADISSWEFIS